MPAVISIAGPAGAGKSQVAKALVRLLGDDLAARVPMDWYLVPRSVPMEAWRREPLAWDHAAVRALLAAPVGETRLTPPFDFTTFQHSAATGERVAIPIRPVMVLDAMAPWPKADLTVLLAVPEAARRARIVARDARWGSHVADRWLQLEATWRQVETQAPRADLTLDGEAPIERTAAAIAAAARERGLVATP